MPRYQLDRSIVIGASPERVYEIIADFGTWTTWSPWLIVEPTTRVTVSKDPAALGSTYAWQGEITGHGELEHKKLIVGELVDDELRFLKPFKATCQTAFKLTREQSGTRVTWTMDGTIPWFLFWMIPMFKTLIGMDYMRGLTMLKDLIESGTMTGGLMNFRPTGRKFILDAAQICRLASGKLIEIRDFRDTGSLLRQLKVAATLTPAAA